MRIGFSSLYSWRPLVQHLYYLATLARKGGHETFFLTCDADLPTCYTREMRNRPAWRECLECRLGGIRSFTGHNIASIGKYTSAAEPVPREWASSSASTLGRFESDADYATPEFARLESRLYPAAQLGYHAAREWIREHRLDAVCVYNGRVDATRGIFEAAKSLGVRVLSVERALFGDGLQLYPDENCLGLQSLHSLVTAWRDRPLTRLQARRAASHIARRFTRTNVNEWRAYNTNAQSVSWPVPSAKRRILLTPSSRNEVWGHPDWAAQWPDATVAYDELIKHLQLSPEDVVLRCHPNWSENIGAAGGQFSERHYADWAKRAGVLCIPAAERASTLSLIEQCDAVVVANGSAALEAGLLGKQVIGLAPSMYQHAGLRDEAGTPEDMARLRLLVELDSQEQEQRRRIIARQTLRFCYSIIYRVPQYTRFVKTQTTTSYRYDIEADPQRLIDLLRTGTLTADDATGAADTLGEDEVLNLVRERKWGELVAAPEDEAGRTLTPIRRRLLARPIDLISNWKPVGDR